MNYCGREDPVAALSRVSTLRKFGQIEWVFIAFGEFDGKISTVEGMMLSPCRLHIALARRSGGLCTIGQNFVIFCTC
jgi:hypothetical protein